jgi:hypothetical protein
VLGQVPLTHSGQEHNLASLNYNFEKLQNVIFTENCYSLDIIDFFYPVGKNNIKINNTIK